MIVSDDLRRPGMQLDAVASVVYAGVVEERGTHPMKLVFEISERDVEQARSFFADFGGGFDVIHPGAGS